MMAPVITTDGRATALPVGGSCEDCVQTVGVACISRGGHGSSNLKLIEVQPDLTDILSGPADRQLAG